MGVTLRTAVEVALVRRGLTVAPAKRNANATLVRHALIRAQGVDNVDTSVSAQERPTLTRVRTLTRKSHSRWLFALRCTRAEEFRTSLGRRAIGWGAS